MAETLTALSQRNEAFWIGLALLLLGVITPDGIGLSSLLISLGAGILVVRLFVGCFRILKTTAVAGAIGYRDGQRNGR